MLLLRPIVWYWVLVLVSLLLLLLLLLFDVCPRTTFTAHPFVFYVFVCVWLAMWCLLFVRHLPGCSIF